MELDSINRELGKDPQALVRWANSLGRHVIAATNFGPFSAVLLHMVTRERPDIPVLWVDSGYGTEATYRYAEEVTRLLKLNVHVYLPASTRAQRDALHGGVPTPDDPRHAAFTQEVKLDPFERALEEMAPGLWFTGIRKEQTAFRAGLSPVTVAKNGVLKVAPVFHWTSKQMHEYLVQHGLPNNFDYYDPTKVEEKRECGLHTVL